MFDTAKSLDMTAVRAESQPKESPMSKVHEAQAREYSVFSTALEQQEMLDRQNITLVSDGIDLLQRLLVTERETQQGEAEPLQEELFLFIDSVKTDYQVKIKQLEAAAKKQNEELTVQLNTIQSQIAQQVTKRKNTLNQMRQEFMKSRDEIQNAINQEIKEREEQTHLLKEAIQKKTAEISTEFNRLEQQKEAALSLERENQKFQVQLTQSAVLKRFQIILDELSGIKLQNQQAASQRVQTEGQVVENMSHIAEKVQSGVNEVGRRD